MSLVSLPEELKGVNWSWANKNKLKTTDVKALKIVQKPNSPPLPHGVFLVMNATKTLSYAVKLSRHVAEAKPDTETNNLLLKFMQMVVQISLSVKPVVKAKEVPPDYLQYVDAARASVLALMNYVLKLGNTTTGLALLNTIGTVDVKSYAFQLTPAQYHQFSKAMVVIAVKNGDQVDQTDSHLGYTPLTEDQYKGRKMKYSSPLYYGQETNGFFDWLKARLPTEWLDTCVIQDVPNEKGFVQLTSSTPQPFKLFFRVDARKATYDAYFLSKAEESQKEQEGAKKDIPSTLTAKTFTAIFKEIKQKNTAVVESTTKKGAKRVYLPGTVEAVEEARQAFLILKALCMITLFSPEVEALAQTVATEDALASKQVTLKYQGQELTTKVTIQDLVAIAAGGIGFAKPSAPTVKGGTDTWLDGKKGLNTAYNALWATESAPYCSSTVVLNASKDFPQIAASAQKLTFDWVSNLTFNEADSSFQMLNATLLTLFKLPEVADDDKMEIRLNVAAEPKWKRSWLEGEIKKIKKSETKLDGKVVPANLLEMFTKVNLMVEEMHRLIMLASLRKRFIEAKVASAGELDEMFSKGNAANIALLAAANLKLQKRVYIAGKAGAWIDLSIPEYSKIMQERGINVCYLTTDSTSNKIIDESSYHPEYAYGLPITPVVPLKGVSNELGVDNVSVVERGLGNRIPISNTGSWIVVLNNHFKPETATGQAALKNALAVLSKHVKTSADLANISVDQIMKMELPIGMKNYVMALKSGKI